MRVHAIFLAAVALALLLFAPGCSEVHYVVGQKPDVNHLEENLNFGQSTKEDVRLALGAPTGDGVFLTPIDSEPRQVWSYYYEVGDVKAGSSGTVDARMRRMFLFVYFADGRYDGYMWFSSLPH